MSTQNRGKECIGCGAWKPLEEFHRRSKSPDGRRSKCKACVREYRQQYGAMRREEAQEAAPSWATTMGGGLGGEVGIPPLARSGTDWWVAFWAAMNDTKVRQAAARKLGVPIAAIEVKRTGGAVLARVVRVEEGV